MATGRSSARLAELNRFVYRNAVLRGGTSFGLYQKIDLPIRRKNSSYLLHRDYFCDHVLHLPQVPLTLLPTNAQSLLRPRPKYHLFERQIVTSGDHRMCRRTLS